MPLEVIIAGAGIAGLSAAIGLTKNGHNVTVYERRTDQNVEESASGIQLQPNSIKILRDWNMLDLINQVSQNSMYNDMRAWSRPETLLLMDMERRGGVRWGVRRDMRRAFEKFARQCGAGVHRGKSVVRVDENGQRVTVELDDGTRHAADFVVGADGTNSRVRRLLFPSYQPSVLSHCVSQFSVPLDKIRTSPLAHILLRNDPAAIIEMGPGRAAVISPHHGYDTYDFQLFDLEFGLDIDPDPNTRSGRYYDFSHLKSRWADHATGMGQAIDMAESYWKWRLVEVTNVPSWVSSAGKAVLIGDACHGMTPYSGQGATTGIEDGATLAEVLADAPSANGLKDKLKMFEGIRRPRTELIRTFARVLGESWGMHDPKLQERRNKTFLKYNSPDRGKVAADPKAPFTSPAFEKWLDEYDVKEEVRKAKAGVFPVEAASRARL